MKKTLMEAEYYTEDFTRVRQHFGTIGSLTDTRRNMLLCVFFKIQKVDKCFHRSLRMKAVSSSGF